MDYMQKVRAVGGPPFIPVDGATLPDAPDQKIESFLSEILVCWSYVEK